MEKLTKAFPEVSSVFVYTREAHPGEKHPAHQRLEDKLQNAREMMQALGIERPMLVDDLQGSVHRAYGALPNMAWIIARRGVVFYRASWTDARSIGWALEQLQHERGARRDGQRLLPYYMEVLPAKIANRHPFLEGLLSKGGARAVDEYIQALADHHGESTAAALRKWRAKHIG